MPTKGKADFMFVQHIISTLKSTGRMAVIMPNGVLFHTLRSEDIEKIAYVYRNRRSLNKYSKLLTVAELEKEEFNGNIRRYVDNSPPAEPHDVHAHLHGGIPGAEVEALAEYWKSYAGIREQLFVPVKNR